MPLTYQQQLDEAKRKAEELQGKTTRLLAQEERAGEPETDEPFIPRPGYESPEEKKIREGMEGLDVTPPTEAEEKGLKEHYTGLAQAQIDAINKIYAGLITREEQAGEERLGQTRAMGARAGLLGSPMGAAQMARTKELTAENIKAVQDEQNFKIQAILGRVDERTEAEIRRRKDESTVNMEKYMNYLKTNLEENKADYAGLAESGVTLARMKANKDYYEQALEECGMSEMEFDFFFESKMPKAQRADFTEYQYRGENGNVWIKKVSFDPETGKMTEYNYDINIPYLVEEEIKTFNGAPYKAVKNTEGNIVSYQRIPGVAEKAEYLSVSEAEKLGVPYGTTKAQARAMGITVEGEKDDWAKGRQFIDDNPKATYEELYTGLSEHTGLGVTDRETLLKEKGKEKTKEAEMYLSEDNMKKTAIALVKKIGKEDAVKAIEHGTIIINKKATDLSPEQIKRIIEIINEEYPKGRSLWQKILPGGR